MLEPTFITDIECEKNKIMLYNTFDTKILFPCSRFVGGKVVKTSRFYTFNSPTISIKIPVEKNRRGYIRYDNNGKVLLSYVYWLQYCEHYSITPTKSLFVTKDCKYLFYNDLKTYMDTYPLITLLSKPETKNYYAFYTKPQPKYLI